MVIRCNAGLKCPAQRTARTTHFASKKALDIRGLAGKANRETLRDERHQPRRTFSCWRKDFTDRIERRKKCLLFGRVTKTPRKRKKHEFTKNALNMFAAINDVKTNGVQLAKFIYALGIPFVGEASRRRNSRKRTKV